MLLNTCTQAVRRCSFTETSRGDHHHNHTIYSPTPLHTHSANILVAENWSVALGDYGVLRVQPSAGTMITTTVAGTQEYMDYDYVTSGVVSEKTDIYSFGVVSDIATQ